MSAEQNKALLRRYVELQNQHNLEAAFSDFSPNFRANNIPTGIPGSLEETRQFFSMVSAAFPDYQATLHDVIAEGDKVVVRFTFSGTHTGEFMGIPPTGKPIHYGIIAIYRIVDGKMAEVWSEQDMMGLMQQIGIVPPLATR